MRAEFGTETAKKSRENVAASPPRASLALVIHGTYSNRNFFLIDSRYPLQIVIAG